MPQITFGAFKGTYRGHGIYWDGQYNTDGDLPSRTLAELKGKIDASITARMKRVADTHAIELAKAKERCLWAQRDGESVTLHTPDGIRQLTIRQYRQEVFDIEEKYGASIVMA